MNALTKVFFEIKDVSFPYDNQEICAFTQELARDLIESNEAVLCCCNKRVYPPTYHYFDYKFLLKYLQDKSICPLDRNPLDPDLIFNPLEAPVKMWVIKKPFETFIHTTVCKVLLCTMNIFQWGISMLFNLIVKSAQTLLKILFFIVKFSFCGLSNLTINIYFSITANFNSLNQSLNRTSRILAKIQKGDQFIEKKFNFFIQIISQAIAPKISPRQLFRSPSSFIRHLEPKQTFLYTRP